MEKKINGNTCGIRNTILARMAEIYAISQPNGTFFSEELIETMAEFTGIIGREISVYVSRNGLIQDVSVGDATTVSMPTMRLVRNIDRLCGVRCIHTHPNGIGILSDVDLGTLNSQRLDAMAAIGVREGKPCNVYVAFVGEMEQGERKPLIYGPMRYDRLLQQELLDAVISADDRLKTAAYGVTQTQPQRAILVGIEGNEGYDTLLELQELAKTAGVEVVHREVQRNRGVDSATYIGSGKAEELCLTANALEADVIIFDDELSAIQMRNLEALLGIPVIDRTMLILDIFAARATTREGKLQVELAQLKYRLPRLMGMGIAMSRQGASCVGMRGPGEKKLEIDRRRIRRRVFELEQELHEIEKQRALRSVARKRQSAPIVALVGYTNSGKSTLINTLTDSNVLAENMLFATLDPVVRQLTLPNGTQCLISDTVGFINKLPHELVQAFHSTLEEVRDADLVLHVVDTTCPYYEVQMRVVEDVLTSLNAIDTPRINVYNKTDVDAALPTKNNGGLRISAKFGTGIDKLTELMEEKLHASSTRVELLVPYAKYDSIQQLRKLGTLIEQTHDENGTHLIMLIENDKLWQAQMLVKE